MKRRLIATTIFVSFCWLTCSALVAQHLESSERAKGKSDPTMCGVNVYKTTVGQAIVKFGQPTTVQDYPEEGRNYDWQRGTINIGIATFNEKGNGSIAHTVEVSGSQSAGESCQTGRGLKLGASLSDVMRIYGRRFSKYRSDDGRLYVTIQWGDATTLELEFDKNDRINKMKLSASIE